MPQCSCHKIMAYYVGQRKHVRNSQIVAINWLVYGYVQLSYLVKKAIILLAILFKKYTQISTASGGSFTLLILLALL